MTAEVDLCPANAHIHVCIYTHTHTCITHKKFIYGFSAFRLRSNIKIKKKKFSKRVFLIQWPHSTLYSLCHTLVSHLNLNSWEKPKSSESKSYGIEGLMHSGDSAPRTVAAAAVGNTHTEAQVHKQHLHTHRCSLLQTCRLCMLNSPYATSCMFSQVSDQYKGLVYHWDKWASKQRLKSMPTSQLEAFLWVYLLSRSFFFFS